VTGVRCTGTGASGYSGLPASPCPEAPTPDQRTDQVELTRQILAEAGYDERADRDSGNWLLAYLNDRL
jgi:hypothetical protein